MTDVNEKENIEEIDANLLEMNDDENIKKALDDAKKMYPIIKFNRIGQMIKGKVINVKSMPELNEGKGAILLNIETGNEKVPIGAIWLNTVLKNQMIQLTGNKVSNNFEDNVNSIEKITGKTIIIRFEGEEKSNKKGYKPYQNFTVIEVN